jgi:hypothetical protein
MFQRESLSPYSTSTLKMPPTRLHNPDNHSLNSVLKEKSKITGQTIEGRV